MSDATQQPPGQGENDPTQAVPYAEYADSTQAMPAAGGGGSGSSGSGGVGDDDGKDRKWLWWTIGIVAVILIIIVVALLMRDDGDGSTDASTTTSSSTTTTTRASTTTTQGTTTTLAPAPRITSFSAGSVSCPADPVGPETVTLTWSTGDTSSQFVGIDSPNPYQSVGPSGSLGVPFSCPGPHTYYLVASGAGQTTTESVTVQGN